MNKKIVVVDDDAVLLQTLERMLAKSDFQVFPPLTGMSDTSWSKKKNRTF